MRTKGDLLLIGGVVVALLGLVLAGWALSAGLFISSLPGQLLLVAGTVTAVGGGILRNRAQRNG